MNLTRTEQQQAISKLLTLDSLKRKITWPERLDLHLLRINAQHSISEKLSEKLYQIAITPWKAPAMRYGIDAKLYYYCEASHQWLPVEQYGF